MVAAPSASLLLHGQSARQLAPLCLRVRPVQPHQFVGQSLVVLLVLRDKGLALPPVDLEPEPFQSLLDQSLSLEVCLSTWVLPVPS